MREIGLPADQGLYNDLIYILLKQINVFALFSQFIRGVTYMWVVVRVMSLGVDTS